MTERMRSGLPYAAAVALVLLVWELATHNVSRILLAPPSAIAARIIDGIMAGTLSGAFLGSLAHMLAGLSLAIAIALPLGMLIGRNRAAANLLEPVLSAIYAIPPVAFVPVIIIWFGLYFEARVALVVLMTVFEMTFAFAAGAREIPPSLIDVGRSFGATRRAIMAKVMFPAMLPFVFTGLRLGIVRAIHGMIVAELFFAAVNLGQIMKREAQRFDSAGVLAIIVLLALFGLVLQEGFKALESKLFAHRRAG